MFHHGWAIDSFIIAKILFQQDKRIGQLIVVNPQWKTQGQLVSEFGIGPWKKANEEFLATFEPSYSLFEQRIGAPSSVNLARGSRYESGGVLRTQRCFPGPYEVHAMAPNGVSQVGIMTNYELFYLKNVLVISLGNRARISRG